jgi:hypothetical protein
LWLERNVPASLRWPTSPAHGKGGSRFRWLPAQTPIGLVVNDYKNFLLDRDQRVSEFLFLHRLLETVPVHRAVLHTDHAYLDALMDLLVEVV